MKEKRHVYMEALRILACLAVIFNHSPRSSYFQFAQREVGSMLYFLELSMSIGCKYAVPTFMAISGALMLHKPISYKKLWTQRIFKAAMLLGVFSLISYLSGVAAGKEVFSLKSFILGTYENKINYAYWYLYAYLAFLIASPMLSTLLRNLKTGEILYMLLAATIVRCVLPAAEQLLWEGTYHLSSDLRPAWLTADIVFYPAIGYFLHHRVDVKTLKKALPILWLAAAACIYVSCRLTLQVWYQTWVAQTHIYHKQFAAVYCAALMATVRVIYEYVPQEGRIARITTALGGCTLGVYLLHVPVMDNLRFFQETVWIPIDALGLPQMMRGMIFVLIMFFSCAGITWILKKIPGFRWLLK